MGQLINGPPPVHRPDPTALSDPRLGKWVVPTYMYEGRYFPKFLSGSGYLVKKEDARKGHKLVFSRHNSPIYDYAKLRFLRVSSTGFYQNN